MHVSQKTRIRLRRAWATWSLPGLAGLASAVLILTLVRLISSGAP